MIYIGSIMLSCAILFNETLDTCSKVNSSLPTNLTCENAKYVNIIYQNTLPAIVVVTSYTDYSYTTSSTSTLYTNPTYTPYNPEFSNQSSGNYIPTIVGVSGIGLALLAGTVGYFVNRKLNKPQIEQSLSPIDDYYTSVGENIPLGVLGPPFRRAYTTN